VKHVTSQEVDKLISKIAKGDIEALEYLYNGMKKPVYFYALRLSNDPEVAEDVMQDTFISIMRNSKSFSSKGKGSSWIFTIARNTTFNHLKKIKQTRPIEEVENLEDESFRIDAFLENESVLHMMTPLNKKERDIVTLRVLIGFTLTEIARELNMPKGSVFWSYHNAMKKLKSFLKGDW
jgi:RNA polymerase sigma-70 factor (ECF subfamily)